MNKETSFDWVSLLDSVPHLDQLDIEVWRHKGLDYIDIYGENLLIKYCKVAGPASAQVVCNIIKEGNRIDQLNRYGL